MFSKIKRLFSDSLIYIFGNTAGKVVGFLLIPLYTHYLTPEDYGILSLCSLFSSLLFVFLNMGLSSAIFKNYFKAQTQEEKNMVISTSGVLMLLVSIPTTILLISKSAWISNLLLSNEKYANAIVLAGLTGIFALFAKLPFSCLRARGETKAFNIYSLADTAFTLILAICFVTILHKGFWGILFSQFLAGIVVCLVLIPLVLKNVTFKFSTKEAKSLLNFGSPLIFAGVGGIVLTLADRYILERYASLNEVGIYSLGYRFGEILWFIGWAFQLAWPHFLFSNENLPEAKTLYTRTATYYFAIMSFICLGLSILAKEIIMLATTPKFFAAYTVIPTIALSQLFYSLLSMGEIGTYLKSKTGYVAVCVGIAALLNIILNFLWIPRYGMMGAAVATLAAYAFQLGITFTVSHKLYPLNFEYGRILRIAITGMAIYLINCTIVFNNIFYSIGFKLFLISLFPVILFISGFFTDDEIALVQRLLAKRFETA